MAVCNFTVFILVVNTVINKTSNFWVSQLLVPRELIPGFENKQSFLKGIGRESVYCILGNGEK